VAQRWRGLLTMRMTINAVASVRAAMPADSLIEPKKTREKGATNKLNKKSADEHFFRRS